MGIAKEDIARIRSSVDLVEVIQEHVTLRKSGLRWMGLCPFHGENTPSFSVNGAEGLYYCFGCQAKGDVISFVQAIDGLDFVGAVERLAGRAHIELHYDNERTQADRNERSDLLGLLQRAATWFHDQLLTAPSAREARKYLRARGYNGDVVRQFQLGWAPDDWDALARTLRTTSEMLTKSGLGFVNRRGKQQDAFRGRIMFPICDASGNPVAFGGRILPGHDGPKYKNSTETPLYAKSKTLYALNWAKTEIATADEVIVCEGYTDVIACFRAGLARAVATCGTSLTDEHAKILKAFATRIVLAYDADAAGKNATERMYAWEKKFDLNVAVADLPEGLDPAETATRDPELLRRAIREAKPFLRFRLDRFFATCDFRTIEGRARAAYGALEMVNEHPDEFVRDQYLLDIAARTRVPIESLRSGKIAAPVSGSSMRAEPSRHRQGSPRRSGRSTSRGRLRAEAEAVRMAIHHPEQVSRFLMAVVPEVDDVLLEEWLFGDPTLRAAFGALMSSDTVRDAMEVAEPEAADLLGRFVMEPVDCDDAHDAQAPYVRLVARAIERAIERLGGQLHLDPTQFATIVREREWLRLRSEELRDMATATDAVRQVLAWFAQSVGETSGEISRDEPERKIEQTQSDEDIIILECPQPSEIDLRNRPDAGVELQSDERRVDNVDDHDESDDSWIREPADDDAPTEP